MPDPILPWPLVKSGSLEHPTRTLQDLLNAHGSALVIDGVFGPKTDAAVRGFQQALSIAVDGIVGPVTWRALVSAMLAG